MKRLVFVFCTLCIAVQTPVWGWLASGHAVLTRAAVRALPEEIPAFFRAGEGTIAHLVKDPDVSKNRGAPFVRGAEYPEHFLDREFLDGYELPKTRYEYIQLCNKAGVLPEKVGFVPYAVAEWTERLAVAFAEYRKWPENEAIQSKCLIYAGFLAHYSQDMCQPLHLTKHYNGWIGADGSVAQKGIHTKVDGLVDYFEMKPDDLAEGLEVTPLSDLMGDIFLEFQSGFKMVGKVYELGERIPKYEDKTWKPVPEVVEFATERTRASVRFTARLYLTAWHLSEKIELGWWLDRSKE